MSDRWEALDEFRGLIMLLFTIFTPLFLFDAIPSWLKHAPTTGGINIADLGAPAFLLAIGISYFISFEKRRRTMGNGALIISFLKRGLLLTLFGFLGELIENFGTVNAMFSRGVLETIGIGIIFVLPFMYASHRVRLVSALAIPLAWQIFLSTGHENYALAHDFAGPWAISAWSSFILFGSALSEVRLRVKKESFVLLLVTIAILMYFVAMGTSSIFIPSKYLVSFPYFAISVGVAVFVFAIFVEKDNLNGPALRLLSLIGKNPFVIYATGGIESIVIARFISPSLGIAPALAITALSSLSCLLLAWALDKKKFYVKI
jgi:hypothetical protein